MPEQENANTNTPALPGNSAVASGENTNNTQKKKKTAPRTMDILISASIKSMSETEKNMLIAELREQTDLLKEQVKAYQNNAESAFRKAAHYEDLYLQLKAKVREYVQYSLNAVHHCNVSLALAAKQTEE